MVGQKPGAKPKTPSTSRQHKNNFHSEKSNEVVAASRPAPAGGVPGPPALARSNRQRWSPPTPVVLGRDSVAMQMEVVIETKNTLHCTVEGGWDNSVSDGGPLGAEKSRVINTQAEYEELVRCWAQPWPRNPVPIPTQIDFAKHILLVGEMWTPALGYPRNIKFSQVCGEYRLNVNLWPVNAHPHALSTYFILVPKLPGGPR